MEDGNKEGMRAMERNQTKNKQNKAKVEKRQSKHTSLRHHIISESPFLHVLDRERRRDFDVDVSIEGVAMTVPRGPTSWLFLTTSKCCRSDKTLRVGVCWWA